MIIKRETLNAVLPATTSEKTRYDLDLILAEPGAHRLIATNGHILLIATDTKPHIDLEFPTVAGAEFHADPAPICIPAAVARNMIATMPKKPSAPILASAQLSQNGSDATATLAATDLQGASRVATLNREDRQFPAYARVLLKPEQPTIRVTLAVDVLEALIKSAKAVAGKNPLITFDVPSDKAVAVSQLGITITGTDVTVTGAAMPCRA